MLALEANRHRYAEFVEIAEDHLADLRSHLEGLAVRAEPSDYRVARRVELRLAWLLRNLRIAPNVAALPSSEWPVIVDTVGAIRTFLRLGDQPASGASPSDYSLPTSPSQRELMDALWMERMGTQQRLVDSEASPGSIRGILLDIDGDLALKYFAIDAGLLDRFSRRPSFAGSDG